VGVDLQDLYKLFNLKTNVDRGRPPIRHRFGFLAQHKPTTKRHSMPKPKVNAWYGWEVARTGKLNLPEPSEKQLGGHAVMAVGYDESVKRVLVRNSWGADWGIKGYFTMPYDYISNDNLADDLWTLRSLETV
jgi:C1A family cysteine protease